MSLDPAFEGALQQHSVLLFVALEVLLPDYALRPIDGAGFLEFDTGQPGGPHLFLGEDPTYGTLGGITDYVDGVDDEAPSLTLNLLPPTNAAMAAIAAPDAQGSQTSMWVGALDPISGEVIGEPDLWFIGETDVPTQEVDRNSRALEVTVVSILDRFFDQDEGARLNNGFHQTMYPGSFGLAYVSLVREPPVWGSSAPKGGVVGPAPIDIIHDRLRRIFGS